MITRSGAPNATSLSPYNGMSFIHEKYMDKSFELTADIEWLFLKQGDFNADKCRPMLSKEEYEEMGKDGSEDLEPGRMFRPQMDKYSDIDYYRRLEDVHEGYIIAYIGNVCFNVYRKAGANGAISYKQAHKPQVTLINSEDEVTEFADLVVEDPNTVWSKEDKEQAKNQLPYVMKRLHNLSLYSGIHMISMAGAFLKAQESLKVAHIHGSVKKLRKNAVIDEGVYTLQRNGRIGKCIEKSSKNVHAEEMFDWIVGTNQKYPSYKDDFSNFLHYCEVLNIDLLKDDLTKYDGDFLQKLDCLVLTPDTQYNVSIFDAIKNNTNNLTEKEVESSISNTVALFTAYLSSDSADVEEVKNTHTTAKRDAYTEKASAFIYQGMLRSGDVNFESNKMHWVDGLLYYGDTLALINTNLFVKESYKMHYALISELGYIIHVTDLLVLEMLTIDSAYTNLRNKLMASDEKLQSFVKFSF